MMRHVIGDQKLKEGVEATRLQLAFMIGFISSSVRSMRCPYFLILAVAKVGTKMWLQVQRTFLHIITLNFLESGYSHMECDSMHFAIEREKRHADVSLCWTGFRCFVELDEETHTKFSIITIKTSMISKNLHRSFLKTSAAILMATWSTGLRSKA